jgi:dTDP-glucose pyrophosphorylase
MFSWKQSTLKAEDTIAAAIEVLEREALRIVLIIDEEFRLLGTVTDGDIRRALMRYGALTTQLKLIMNQDPVVASANEEKSVLLKKMSSRNLLHIPLLDESRRLVGMETFQHLVKKPVFDNVVFLMAGGFGTRLHPLTLDIPKPLLKVGSKPILETIINQFISSGFHNFYISTHYKAQMVKEHFGNGEKWDVNIKYINETTPRGTAGALGLLPKDIPDLPVLVMNGDLLTQLNHERLLTYHNEQKGIATMCVREYDFEVPYGVVETEDARITSIVEKPRYSFFVNAGVYVLDTELIRRVNGGEYLDMPNLLSNSIAKGETVNIFPLHEYWLDIGNMPDYDRANSDVQSFAENGRT